MIDFAPIQQRVRRAIQSAGADPWLVAYDANGIQELVTASSRPLAMFGASATIAAFDKATSARDGWIFAGGGRGVELVGSREAAEARAQDLVRSFREQTLVGVMATALAPYHSNAPADSLRWLRQKLDIQKDQAPPPGGALPTDKRDQCADCRMFRAVYSSERTDAPNERICERCRAMLRAGRKASVAGEEPIQSLLALSPSRRVAAVSADGNDVGDFFASLTSLEQMAAASEAIHEVFRDAHDEARATLRHGKVSLATGGDDLRLFLAVEDLLDYTGAFVPALERRLDQLASLGAPFSRQEASRLARVGVGIGAVVADAHFPASRLMAYAHALERSAKRLCRNGGARSAFDFAILRAGDASFSAIERRCADDGRPFPMDAESWADRRRQAEALAAIPGAQRGILAESRALDPVEFANLLRYQVARSKPWQRFYDAVGVDFRDPAAIVRERPRQALLDLVRLLPSSKHNDTEQGS
ncbi:Cas10/Cmr2 second palm domain-containing protein [Sorangium sp. So ce426]|uniref:Cas10/Cmr2 second palm domain-containing protein n=1 Tax=Sorangium sp. So ce426 TaxID=3133312 RepID=UPI003F5C3731